MKKALRKKDFSYLCPLNRDDFEVVEGGHYCDSCEQKVFDVSDCSLEELMALKKQHSNLCVSFKSTIVATTLALSVASCDTPIEPPLMGVMVAPIEKNVTIPPKGMMMGKVSCDIPPKKDKEKKNDK